MNAEKANRFTTEVKKLLITQINQGKVSLSKESINAEIFLFEPLENPTYKIVNWVWDKLDTDTQDKIDNFWNAI